MPAYNEQATIRAIVATIDAKDGYTHRHSERVATFAVRLAREVLGRQGYTLLPATPGALGLESDWDVHLSSHWRDGFRTKIEVYVDSPAPGRSLVRIRDRREFNDDAKNPMNGAAASWTGASLDEKHKRKLGEPAMRVRQLLKLKLEGQP